jgi:hypothetical protein
MSKGLLIYALNNEQVDYTKIALYAAKQVKKHLNIPIALVTDSFDWLSKQCPNYKDYLDILIKVVHQSDIGNFNLNYRYPVGSLVYYEHSIWKKEAEGEDILPFDVSELNLSKEYVGIDVDKWYPNLPYLTGQHVWYENKLYRCREEYSEDGEFSLDKYDLILDNVKELSCTENFLKGDLLLYERTLWLCNSNIDKINVKINNEIWKNTNEVQIVYSSSPQYRRYFDGAMSFRRLRFKNDIRVKSFELSPFDETLVIDCDYLINNDVLKYCWEQSHDFLIYKNSVDLSGFRYDPRLVTLSDKSIDFYWATVFYFRKNKNTETFFNLLSHIQDNWNYYRYVYQIDHSLYRNDFAFSIAIHIMNGYQTGSWAHELPGTLYYSIDKDILLKHNKEQLTLLLEKEKYKGEYTLIKTKGINVHVMNKFSLSRVIEECANE